MMAHRSVISHQCTYGAYGIGDCAWPLRIGRRGRDRRTLPRGGAVCGRGRGRGLALVGTVGRRLRRSTWSMSVVVGGRSRVGWVGGAGWGWSSARRRSWSCRGACAGHGAAAPTSVRSVEEHPDPGRKSRIVRRVPPGPGPGHSTAHRTGTSEGDPARSTAASPTSAPKPAKRAGTPAPRRPLHPLGSTSRYGSRTLRWRRSRRRRPPRA